MLTPLVADALFGTNFGRLLVAIVALLVVIGVGRAVLNLAWRILLLAGMVVALLYVLSLIGL